MAHFLCACVGVCYRTHTIVKSEYHFVMLYTSYLHLYQLMCELSILSLLLQFAAYTCSANEYIWSS